MKGKHKGRAKNKQTNKRPTRGVKQQQHYTQHYTSATRYCVGTRPRTPFHSASVLGHRRARETVRVCLCLCLCVRKHQTALWFDLSKHPNSNRHTHTAHSPPVACMPCVNANKIISVEGEVIAPVIIQRARLCNSGREHPSARLSAAACVVVWFAGAQLQRLRLHTFPSARTHTKRERSRERERD